MARIRNKQILVASSFDFNNQDLINLKNIISHNGGVNPISITASSVDVLGNFTISGDLTVNGITTNINTTNLNIEDKNVVLNKGGSLISLNGAGFDFEANGVITEFIRLNTTTDQFNFSTGILLGDTTPGFLQFFGETTKVNSIVDSTGTPVTMNFTTEDEKLVTKGYVDKVISQSTTGQSFTVNGDNATTDLFDFGSGKTLDFIGTDGIVATVGGDINKTTITLSLNQPTQTVNFVEFSELAGASGATITNGNYTSNTIIGLVTKNGTQVSINGIVIKGADYTITSNKITILSNSIGYMIEPDDEILVFYIKDETLQPFEPNQGMYMPPNNTIVEGSPEQSV